MRLDLIRLIDELGAGSFSRDLLSSRDRAGRDPLQSYGDVSLHRHTERLRALEARVPSDVQCELGRHCMQVLISFMFSGRHWGAWLEATSSALLGLLHADWAEVGEEGWPLMEVLGLVTNFSVDVTLPENCDEASLYAAAAPGTHDEWAALQEHECALMGAVSSMQRASAGELSLQEAQRSLLAAIGMDMPLMFAHPLAALYSAMAGRLRQLREERLAMQHLDIVYCGHLHIKKKLRNLCKTAASCEVHLKLTKREGADWVCNGFYRATLPWLQMGGSTLFISPYTWQWYPEMETDVLRLIRESSRWREQVALAGLPCMNRTRTWNWPVRRVSHGYWKLSYIAYPTGHETSQHMSLAEFCAVGDTTSATRIYTTDVLGQLADLIARWEEEYPESLPDDTGYFAQEPAANWFVELDIAAKQAGVRAHTFMPGASLENDYKARAFLSPRMARTFHVEAARFVPETLQRHCLFSSSRTASEFATGHGLVVPWCIRKRLRKMFQDVGNWWLALSPRGHIIVPVSASVLNLFRSGDLDIFPWDADVDANFIANHPIALGGFLAEHEAALAQMGYSYILRGDRAVIRDLEDSVRMDIWITGPQEVGLYDIRARLCGVRVNFFREQLLTVVWYYRPGVKILGNAKGRLLQCFWTGHNACLPDCVRGGLGIGDNGCEFDNFFVSLDS